MAELGMYLLGGTYVGWSLELGAGLAVLLWFVLGWAPLLRRIVPAGAMRAAVHRRALLAFVQNRVYRTRDASGVLILVSELERRVEILADEGIHARIGVEGWQGYVQTIITGMKEGRSADGIVQTIEAIGGELAEGVPIKPDDENELSNEVVVSAH